MYDTTSSLKYNMIVIVAISIAIVIVIVIMVMARLMRLIKRRFYSSYFYNMLSYSHLLRSNALLL